MKNVVGLLLKAAITVTLVACAGQSNDPLKEYKDVKAVPAHENKSQEQTIEVQLFRIVVDGASEKNYGNFTINKSSSVVVKVVQMGANNRIQDANLQVRNFGGSDQPTVAKISGDTFRLTWTPKAASITDGGNFARKDFQVAVIATVAGRTTELTKDLVFTVSRDVAAPKITGTSGLEGISAVEGQVVEFTVDVNDPNYTGAAKPQLHFPEYANTNVEAFMADASAYKKLNPKYKNNPQHLGGTSFRFFYVLNLKDLPETYDRKGQLDSNAASVPMCLNIGAESVAGARNSVMEQECFEAKYNAQPANVKFADNNRKVMAGEENKVSFTLSTDNKTSSITLKDAQKQVSNLNGAKNLECSASDEKSSTLNCLLTWTPVCNVKSSANSALLKLSAESSLNKLVKKTAVEEQFSIDNGNCEAQAKAKTEADQKAKEEKAKADQAAKEQKAAADKLAKEEAAKVAAEKAEAKKVEAAKKAQERKDAQSAAAAKVKTESKTTTAPKAEKK